MFPSKKAFKKDRDSLKQGLNKSDRNPFKHGLKLIGIPQKKAVKQDRDSLAKRPLKGIGIPLKKALQQG